MIIWVIGKSGSGKTFFSKKIYNKLKIKKKKIFLLDGDDFRKYISYDLKYSSKDRKINSLRIQNFCKYMDKNGFNVICSIQSIFPKDQKKNRKLFSKYFQVHLKADKQDLIQRNNKRIYSKKKDVVGKDIKFPKPYRSNYEIKNKFNNSLNLHVNKIVKKIYAKLQ